LRLLFALLLWPCRNRHNFQGSTVSLTSVRLSVSWFILP
jgi:hypothetical protein